jgi:hypothetical protein
MAVMTTSHRRDGRPLTAETGPSGRADVGEAELMSLKYSLNIFDDQIASEN